MKTNAQDLHARFMLTAAIQLTNSADARAITAAGFGAKLWSIVEAISGNVANPLADELTQLLGTL